MAKFKRLHEDIMDVYDESFKREEVEYEKDFMDKFAQVTGIIAKIIIGFIILVYGLFLVYVFGNFAIIKEETNPDVGKYLEKQYDCTFVVTPRNVDEKGNGTYTAYNKRNKNIVFEVEKNKTQITDTYMTEAVRYYLENKMVDYNLEEYNITRENEKAVCFNVSSLDELEKIVEFIYELNKMTMKELKGYSNVTGYVMIRCGDYFYYPYIGTDKTVEEIVESIKIDYENSKK